MQAKKHARRQYVVLEGEFLNWKSVSDGVQQPRYLNYEERLRECVLTNIERMRLEEIKLKLFRILNVYENIDRNILLSLKIDSTTRGHVVTLVKVSVDWISGITRHTEEND